ncbi:DMT family transporter [Desulfocastanea catecholica]
MPLLTYFSLVFTMLLWGGTFIAGRLLADSVAPASAAFLRFVIASSAMLVVTLLVEKKLLWPPKMQWLPLILLGMTGVFAYNVFFFNGLHHISGGRASLIISCTPLVITIFATFFLRERLTALKSCGVLLSLSGAVTVISNGHPGALFTGGFGPGEQALLGCVLSWSAYSIIGRSVLQTLSPLSAVCYSSMIGTLLLAVPAAREGLFSRLSTITSVDWTSLAYLGFFGTAIGFSLYYQAIKKIGATRAGIFINLVPLFSILLSWLILGESVKPVVLAGGLLILTGVSLTNYQTAAKVSSDNS